MTPACQTSKVGEIGGTFLVVYRRVVIHWRAIILLLILSCVAFLVAHSDEFGRFELILFALLLLFIASQIFWLGRLVDVGERFIPGRPRRFSLVIMTVVVYLFVCLYSYPEWGQGHVIRPADYRPQSMLIHAAFWWWFVGSMSAFFLVIVFGATDRVARAAGWAYRKVHTATHEHSAAADAEAALLSPGRRRFLERAAVLVSATPSSPPAMGFCTSDRMWKWLVSGSGWRACPKPLMVFASPSFPTFTLVPSLLRTTFAAALLSPTD